MGILNHYSALIAAGLVLILGARVIRRIKGTAFHWVILAVLVTIWAVMMPKATETLIATGNRHVLLEIESPFCLGCLAVKPTVDRLEHELTNQLVVWRVNVRSPAGRLMTKRYNVEVTPTFILLDQKGQEQWRSMGGVDESHLRASLGEKTVILPLK